MENEILRRNNVKVSGKGTQPMLFVHGFGCDQTMWRFITPAFENDYKVVLMDFVGAGKSDISAYNDERYSSLQGYVQDILDVCNALELKEVIFVGHSISCMIGALASIQSPATFQNLIMVGASPRYVNDGKEYFGGFDRKDLEGMLESMEYNYSGWASFLSTTIMKHAERPELGKELEQILCSIDQDIARKFAKITFFSDNRSELLLVNSPTLILQCADDVIAPESVGTFVLKALPRGTLMKMKAKGHCPHMTHPEETVEVIKNYLSAVTA